jgi:hypothetical protein
MSGIMITDKMSPAAIAEELGNRLKQARLNADITKADIS